MNLSQKNIAQAQKLGFTIGHSANHGQLGIRVTNVGIPPGMSVAAAQAMLDRELPGDAFVPNRVYTPYRPATEQKSGQTNGGDATGVRQAGHKGCDADRCYGPTAIGWTQHLSTCAQGVRIGLVDTSVDFEHSAFLGGKSRFVPWPENPRSAVKDPHGTSVLSVLAGDPKSGTPGLVPDATFLVADVFQTDAQNRPISDTSRLLAAFNWLQTQNVEIINLSLAGPPDELMQKMIDQMSRKGVIFVAAAGNGGPSAPPSYPAAYKDVVSVTAVGKDFRAYRYANRGDYIDVAAPGVEIWSAFPNSQEGFQTGTSFAVPYVTAMLASAYKTAATKNKQELLSLLPIKDLGAPGKDPTYGRGLMLAPASCAPASVAAKGWMTTVSRTRQIDEKVNPSEAMETMAGIRPSGAMKSSFTSQD